MEMDNKDLHW